MTTVSTAASPDIIGTGINIIDADAHVIEWEGTWEYLRAAEQQYRPIATVVPDNNGNERKVWLIDGRLFGRAVGDHSIPDPIRELRDIEARLRVMDELGIKTQVLYPTLFIGSVTERPEVETALDRSYNRWLADVYQQSHGRLPWILVPPLRNMDAALAEVEFGAENGACGVSLRGLEGNRTLADRSLFPLYEKAANLNLPICIHVGCGAPGIGNIFYSDETSPRRPDIFLLANIPVLSAFHTMLVTGIPARFPKLRIGFIEAGAQWVPYVIGEALRRQNTMGTEGKIDETRTTLRRNRMYVAVRTDNDVAGLIEQLGSDNMVMGTDYGHEDAASEIDAFQTMSADSLVKKEDLQKIMTTNAKTFYGL